VNEKSLKQKKTHALLILNYRLRLGIKLGVKFEVDYYLEVHASTDS